MNIQTKLLALLLPFVLLPLIGIGWSNFSGARSELRSTFRAEADSRLWSIGHATTASLRVAMSSAQQLQASLVVQRYAGERDPLLRTYLVQPLVLTAFLSHMRSQPDFLKIAYISRDGSEEVRVGARRWGDPGSVVAAIRRALRADGKPVTVLLPELAGAPFLAVAAPIENGGSRAGSAPGKGAILVVQLRADRILRQMDTFAARYGYVALVGADGRPILQAQRAGAAIPAGALSIEHGLHDLVPGLSLRARADLSVADARMRETWDRMALLTLAAVLIASVLFHWALRWLVVGPIRTLTSVTESIAAGALDINLTYRANDELGDLAESVRNMAAQLKRSKDRADYIAYHDHLTGLPNRRFFMTSLENAIVGAKRRGQRLGILFLDLDEFKQINDAYGHEVGDKVLVAFGRRLKESVRGEDLLGATGLSRMGGDEFFVLLDPIHAPVDAASLADRLLSILEAPIVTGDIEHRMSASIGIATYPDDGTTTEALIRHADIALYHAKALGKDNYQFFSDALNLAARRRAAIADGLRSAVALGELTLVYEPTIDLRTGCIAGAEGRLRWCSADLGVVAPEEFVPVAVETGMMREIGVRMLHKAFEDWLGCTDSGSPPCKISVHVSASQLRSEDAREQLLSAIGALALPRGLLELGFAEVEVLREPERFADVLVELRALGVSLALDNLGKGHSSLVHLRKLRFHVLKIDPKLIADLPDDRDAPAIILAVLSVGRALGMETVAEGVEHQAQAEFLMRQGCAYAQGSYFHEPVTRDGLVALIEKESDFRRRSDMVRAGKLTGN